MLFCCKKNLKKYGKGIDKVWKGWYNGVTKYKLKGEKMGNAKKISISLNEKIIEQGKVLAERRGIPHFSTFISVLIAEEEKRQRKEKNNVDL